MFDLRKLSSVQNREFPITTLYVSIDYTKQNRRKHIVEFKKMVRYKKQKTYFKELSERAQESVLSDFERIENWLENEFIPESYISAVCFSSAGSGLWETAFLRPEVENILVIQPQPYIHPLARIMSENRNFALVLVDRAKARILQSHLGEYKELYSVENNEVMGNVVYGGFSGTEERRSERKIQESIVQHYKQVAQKLFQLNQKHHFHWLILGGRKDAVSEFEKYLHSYLLQAVSGRVYVEPQAALDEVLEKVKKILHQAQLEYEKKMLAELSGKIKSNGSAVRGTEAVITTLLNNQAERLLIQRDFVRKGVACRDCTYVGLEVKPACPQCGGKLERTNDIINPILNLAYKQNCAVEYVKSAMDEVGDIAVFLRYPLSKLA